MYQPGTVGMRQAAAELLGQIELHPQRDRLGALDQRPQRLTRHEFHGDERMALVLTDVEHSDDVGVLEAPCGTRLLHEPGAGVRVFKLVANHLDGKRAP